MRTQCGPYVKCRGSRCKAAVRGALAASLARSASSSSGKSTSSIVEIGNFLFHFWSQFFFLPLSNGTKWPKRKAPQNRIKAMITVATIMVAMIAVEAKLMCAGGSRRFKFFKMFKNAFKRRQTSLLTVSFSYLDTVLAAFWNCFDFGLLKLSADSFGRSGYL